MREKIPIKKRGGRKAKIKVRYLAALVVLVLSACLGCHNTYRAQASGCPDVRVVFARGSGGERWVDKNYLEFKNTIKTKLATTALSYDFVDLDYPAVGVGVENLGVTLRALVGAGEAYEFGESVNIGVKNLVATVNSTSCPNTKYVVGGYSQGAMVASKALSKLNADKVIYAATFGDPKLYLPEGKGLVPAACSGKNLSSYRMYVPDCYAYKGLLGAYVPYEPERLRGKVGVWCNKRDIFCSSRHFNVGDVADHVSYISDKLYEDASRVIFDKVAKTFGLENRISSPHDTAILIDSTGSMESMIETYKAEARRLAAETLAAGGRVALYDYRDLDDPYTPVEHCDFNTCTQEIFEAELNEIHADGGGDEAESLLSASLHVMKKLDWKYGSTKSLIVLTDADFLSPDRDGTSFDEVVRVSKAIDPVNFYIITEAANADYYRELVSATDGKVVTNFDELNLLTDYIMERYDSLPRVEESSEALTVPVLEVEGATSRGNEATVRFKTTAVSTLVALNDAILGVTNEREIIITGLDTTTENVLTLVPLGEGVRGEAVEIPLSGMGGATGNTGAERAAAQTTMPVATSTAVPKAPNTGKRK